MWAVRAVVWAVTGAARVVTVHPCYRDLKVRG